MTVADGRIPAFYTDEHQRHDPPSEFLHGRLVPYFERPLRIATLRQALEEADIIEVETHITPATRHDASLIHDAALISFFEHTATNVRTIVGHEYSVYRQPDVPENPYYYANIFPPARVAGGTRYPHFITDNACPIGAGTWPAMLASAGLAKRGAEALLAGQRLAYAMCRPPGHHAGQDFAGGYCYLNNAALAARLLAGQGRVAILDVDYHHGNGTQSIFWDDPDVLFVSIHIDPAHDYPYYSGTASETGGPAAQGLIINHPLPPHVSNTIYLETLRQALSQIEAFNPVHLVISLGFDIYVHDQIGMFNADVAEFEAIGRAIHELNRPTLIVQEGGYTIDALGSLAIAFMRGIMGR